MITYIALLRGINVTGRNKIKMVDLKQLFIDLGYFSVTTYIQSGNVIFKAPKLSRSKIEQSIIEAINLKFGYIINVLVLTAHELKIIFEENPFINENGDVDISKLHVTLLNNKPLLKEIQQLNKLILTSEDSFKIVDKFVYLNCLNGYGKTALNNNFFERKLNVSATTRNWNTITKLLEISNL